MKQILITVLSVSSFILLARERDLESRTATVTVPVKGNQELILDVKNTELTVETWDKPEIYIEATVKMKSSATEKHEEFLENWQGLVSEGVNSSGIAIRVNSAFKESKEVNKKTFLGLVISMTVSYNNDYDISYRIKSPANNPIEIVGSYKNVSLVGNYKKVDLELYGADFEAGDIDQADLELKYGMARVGSIKQGKVRLYENKLEAEAFSYLKLETKYSKVKVKKMGTLDLDAYNTEFFMNDIANIKGGMKYSELEVLGKAYRFELELYDTSMDIGSIKELEMQSKYGKFTANSIQELSLESSYQDEFAIGTLGSFISEETKYGAYEIEKLTNSLELEGYEDKVEIDTVSDTATEISIGGKYVETTINLNNTPILLEIDASYGDFSFDKSKMEVSREIQEGNNKQVTAKTKGIGDSSLKIALTGYEMKLELN